MPANITVAEMREIAQEAAKEAVERTLLSLGIDPSSPIKAQEDFAALRELRHWAEDEEMRADFAHIRKWRRTMEDIRSKGFTTMIGLLITGAIGLLVVGLKDWTHR